MCNTVKMNEVYDDAIYLRFFPFSLHDRVRYWLQSIQPDNSYVARVNPSILYKVFFHLPRQPSLGLRLAHSYNRTLNNCLKLGITIKELLRKFLQHGYPD